MRRCSKTAVGFGVGKLCLFQKRLQVDIRKKEKSRSQERSEVILLDYHNISTRRWGREGGLIKY